MGRNRFQRELVKGLYGDERPDGSRHRRKSKNLTTRNFERPTKKVGIEIIEKFAVDEMEEKVGGREG
jgi:hypothetical protein